MGLISGEEACSSLRFFHSLFFHSGRATPENVSIEYQLTRQEYNEPYVFLIKSTTKVDWTQDMSRSH